MFSPIPRSPAALRSFFSQLLRTCVILLLLGAAGQASAVDVLVSNLTDSPDPAVRGGKIVYHAEITNNATDVAHDVVLTFVLDPQMTYVGNSAGCSYDAAGNTVKCSYATVNGDVSGPGTADVIEVDLTVATKATAGGTVSLTAGVTTSDTDTSAGNDQLSQLTTLDDGADMALALSANSATVAGGGTLAYTGTVTNNGPNAAGSVRAAFTLSPNLAYQSASGAGWSCSASGQVATCTRASAAVGTLPAITINARETGAVTGTITSAGVVSVISGATDTNNGNDNATADVTVTAGTDLAISKTASSGTPAAGTAMSFTLAPRNLGPFPATNVTVTDTLPAGFTGIGASGAGWTCGVAGQTVSCTRASYAVGAANDVTVTASAPTAGASASFTNTAGITSDTPDPVSGNNSGSVTVNVLPDGVDLSVTKTSSPNPVAQGGNITNLIRVSNAGPRAAASGEAQVIDTLPAGETYLSYSGSNWSCAAAGSVVTCAYNASLGVAGTSAALTIITSADAAGTLTNNACVSYTDGGAHGYLDPVAGNNCAAASVVSTVSPSAVDLRIAKSASLGELAWNAASFDYTLTVTNAGPGSATGVVVRDVIPGYKSGGTGIVASLTGGTSGATFSCANGSTVICSQTGGSMASGSTAVFTITVSRPMYDSSAQAGGMWTNTATVTSTDQGDTAPANNSASVQVKVDPVADITVHASVTPSSTQAGTEAVYVFTVDNAGPSTATAVTLANVFSIPAGSMSFLSATPSAGSCAGYDAGTHTLNCSLGDIAEGGTATVTVKVRPDYMAAPPSPRIITANATVATTTQESDTTNNTSQTPLSVTQAAVDLLVNNTDNPDPLGFVPASGAPAFPDNVVTYRNTVTNHGPSVASGLVLKYTMTPPSGKKATFLGGKPGPTGQGYVSYCDNANAQVTGGATLTITCTFPASYILDAGNATTDLYLDFRVDTQPSGGGDTFASSVTISSSEPDSLAANNSVAQNTTVRMRTDLQLAKTARAYIGNADVATAAVQVRQPFYWVLTLTNAGPGDSLVTRITDALPAGVQLYTPAGTAPAPYAGAPYNGGVKWTSNNASPGAGSCSAGGGAITCNIGLLESGKTATVLVPVVANAAGSVQNCASATTSEVDPIPANNTNACSTVTVQESSLAGSVYADLDNNGAKGGAESGIAGAALALSGTDNYGNTVSLNTSTDAGGAFAFQHLADGTYALAETQPAGYQDGKDAAGSSGGVAAGGVGGDAVTAITLARNTAATGYLFGELPSGKIAGNVFIDSNSDATRQAGETVGVSAVSMTLVGTDDLGAVNLSTTTGSGGAYSFANLRPGTYTVTEAILGGLTHTGMYVGSKGGQDGASVVSANTALPGASKRGVGAIVLGAGDQALKYDFGESGQGLSGAVYVDLNGNGVRDAGEPGIAHVSVSLSGHTASGNDVCAEISPNPCTVQTGTDGLYNFTGVPASDGSGYTIAEQAQNTAPLSNYIDGAEHAGSLGGSTAVNDKIGSIMVGIGQFGSGYDFAERGASIAARVYHDRNDNGSADGGEPGIAGVTVKLSGVSADGHDVCTLIASCGATTAADGSVSFTALPASNASGYTLTETQPPDYTERSNTPGTAGGSAAVVGADSVISGIVTATGASATGYLFGEKTATISGHVYADTSNDGLRQAGEPGIAGVTVKLSGATASGADVCTFVNCTAVTAADGSYAFANVANAGAGGYALTEQAQNTAPLASYLDGKLAPGPNCGACTKSGVGAAQSTFGALVVDGGKTYPDYDFAELLPASLAGHVYKDANANAVLDVGEALAGVTVTLTGTDDLGQSVNLAKPTLADGSYAFTGLRPGTYAVAETQPASLADFAGASGTQPGTIGAAVVGSASPNAVGAIALGAGASATNYDFRDKPGSLAGAVYVDLNDNGILDAGEAPVGGVKLRLTGTDSDGAAVDVSVSSGADGTFSFSGLKSGVYAVVETQPAGYLDGKETAGSVGGAVNNAGTGSDAAHNAIGTIGLAAGVDAIGYRFGEHPAPVGSSIGGIVYLDLNANGKQDADEPGLAGVSLVLQGKDAAGGALQLNAASGPDGSFFFMGVPASDKAGYALAEIQPAAYLDGTTSVAAGNPGAVAKGAPVAAGARDLIDAIVIVNGAALRDYRFGEQPMGRIGGRVYVDQDRSGGYSSGASGDAGLAGVTVTLQGKTQRGTAIKRSTVTGADGGWLFDRLEASDAAGYTLLETQPDSYADGATTPAPGGPGKAGGAKPVAAGGMDTIAGVVLENGAQLAGYEFGEYPLQGAALSGRVYVDTNNDGLAQAGEAGIAGVTVQLSGVDNKGKTVAASMLTGADGGYRFTALAPSDAAGYRIVEVQPAGWTDGKTSIAASNPGRASAAKPVGVGNQDAVAGIVLGDKDLGGYDFGEVAVPQLKAPLVNGYVWLDRTHDRVRPLDDSQQGLAGWTVQLRQNGNLVCTVQTDAKGFYQFDNLHCAGHEASGLPTGSGFSIAFSKDGNHLPAVAMSGGGRGDAAPTGGLIDKITLSPGDAVVEQNLPLDPAGVVYDSLTRKPVAGAVVTISGPPGFDVNRHLVGGSAALVQTVGSDGMYQFLLQNDYPSGVYQLAVAAPAGYLPAPSATIPPCVGTATVRLQPMPALVQASDGAPAASVPLHNPSACAGIVAGGARTTQYYQGFMLTNGGSAPVLNNHLPLDPVAVDGLQLSKTTPLVNVARGDLVPYTIAVTNSRKSAVPASVNDILPPGFQYKAGSARMDGAPVAAKVAGRTLSFAPRSFGAGEKASYSLVLVVGAGVGEGEYVNQAVAIGTATGAPVSNLATATVRIVPDPTFDCPDVIGKVFDDGNRNGYQDQGERGIPGVRLVTPRGLLVTTDAEGRWHVPCADLPNPDRGSNFVIKLDDRTLPSGYRVTTENPGSVRITRGKVVKLNFGAAIHRVVRIELSDDAFEAAATRLQPQWNQQIDTMMKQLDGKPSVVRIGYRRGRDDAALVQRRMEAVRDMVRERWRDKDRDGGRYPLAVELEDAQ